MQMNVIRGEVPPPGLSWTSCNGAKQKPRTEMQLGAFLHDGKIGFCTLPKHLQADSSTAQPNAKQLATDSNRVPET